MMMLRMEVHIQQRLICIMPASAYLFRGTFQPELMVDTPS